MNDLTELVDRATGDAPWDPDRLVADAVHTGRARVRRRRRGELLAGGAVVAFVAVTGIGMGVAVLPGQGSADRGVPDPTTPAPATGAVSPSAAVHREIAPGPRETGRLLAEVLSTQGFTATNPQSWHQTPPDRDVYRGGSVLIDGAEVSVLIQHQVLDRCGEQPPGAACDSVGGGWEWTFSADEPESGGSPSGIVSAHASLATPDHFTISATAYNAAADKHVAPVQDAPVLGEAQLRALVEDPAWLTP